jgi:hypothetical protein
MGLVRKIIAGSECRKTRAHSEKGDIGFRGASDLFDFLASLRTTCRRLISGTLPVLPWLTYPAIRFIARNLRPDARVFEFGGGMSTLWYEKHAAEVHTVEDNAEWFKILKSRTTRARLINAANEEYARVIDQFEDSFFDMIVVDGKDRLRCFQRGERHLKPGGIMVVDDTDKDQGRKTPLADLDRVLSTTNSYQVHRFIGWVPGGFWVKETTIAIKRADA